MSCIKGTFLFLFWNRNNEEDSILANAKSIRLKQKF